MTMSFRDTNKRVMVRPRARDLAEAMSWLREKGFYHDVPSVRLALIAEGLMRVRVAVDSKARLP